MHFHPLALAAALFAALPAAAPTAHTLQPRAAGYAFSAPFCYKADKHDGIRYWSHPVIGQDINIASRLPPPRPRCPR